MQRLTDQEIVHWLHDEKKIDVGRSSVTTIKNQVQKYAEEWYMELRDSGAKYIAIYKERLDSLLSYQKKLHEIINQQSEESPELVVRAICELHRIEISLHTLMKELPGDIATSKDRPDTAEEMKKASHLTFDEWMSQNSYPRVEDDSQYSDEENGQYYWSLHKKYNEYVRVGRSDVWS